MNDAANQLQKWGKNNALLTPSYQLLTAHVCTCICITNINKELRHCCNCIAFLVYRQSACRLQVRYNIYLPLLLTVSQPVPVTALYSVAPTVTLATEIATSNAARTLTSAELVSFWYCRVMRFRAGARWW